MFEYNNWEMCALRVHREVKGNLHRRLSASRREDDHLDSKPVADPKPVWLTSSRRCACPKPADHQCVRPL